MGVCVDLAGILWLCSLPPIKPTEVRAFLSELRRRNVVKVATVYIVVGWGVIQAADVLFPALTLPKWTVTLVVALVIAGFPISLMLAWAFELTPSGIARENSDAVSADSKPAAADRRIEPAPVPISARKPLEAREQRSLAVLPFVDMSPGHDHEYFADGLAEELLDALARVAELRVPSRTSCFGFKGKDVDVAVVAERLRVSHVLEGSVRRSGERIRVAAKLVEASSDTQLWSEIYDRQIEDIFAIQSDIAGQIVSALQLRLLPQDAVHATTRDASAYELYLRGLSFLHRFGPKSVRFAIDMFRRAAELDPNFAKAWAGLAKAHATLAIYYSGDAADLQASDEASRRSMELAPRLAEAHTARGVSFLAQKRYDEAAAQFEYSVTQNPRSFDAWYQYARTALHQGALEKALELFEKASEVDPDDYQSPLIAAPVYRKLGYEAKALEAERRGVALAESHLQSYPDNARAYFLATAALDNLGESEKALAWANRAIAIDPDDATTRYNVACFYAQVGDADKAFAFLQGSVTSRTWLDNDPELDPIRDDPRFHALLRTLKE